MIYQWSNFCRIYFVVIFSDIITSSRNSKDLFDTFSRFIFDL